ncbi:hypothetical protein BDW22DRAFT_1400007 [Trametopsis cervina]|nr:hypothetical protein BDW22DRAFT_1400007 [Trametopsis cervina]
MHEEDELCRARSSPPVLTAVEQTRLDLQNAIVQHTQTILDMKHQLNTLAPPSVLPPEILSEIFMHLASAQFTVPRGNPYAKYAAQKRKPPPIQPYQWITLTHVCQQWRLVALSSPRLWSMIWIMKKDCVQEMLSRSRRVPLAVKATSLLHRTDSLELVMSELPRIISFDVNMPPHLAKRDYALEAPRLRELVLQSAEAYEMLTLGTSQLQSHFTQCSLPCLEKLQIFSFFVTWTNPLLKPTLTHLTLHGNRLPNTVHIEEVLTALENLPLLETLDLKCAFPASHFYDQQALPEVSRVIDLPSLRKLRFYDNAVASAQFLRHVSFPPHTTMDIDSHVTLLHQLTFLYPAILAKLDHTTHDAQVRDQLPVIRTLYIRNLPETSGTQLMGWTFPIPVEQLADKNATHPEPFIDIAVRVNGLLALLNFVRTVPLADVEVLLFERLVAIKRLDKLDWTRSFESMPKLRELGLSRWGQDHLHQALDHRIWAAEEPSAKKRRKRKQFCNPNLSVLYLRDVSIRPLATRNTPDDDIFLGRLRKSLALRQKMANPIGKLIFHECANLEETDAKSMEEFVDTIEVDTQVDEPDLLDSEDDPYAYPSEDEDDLHEYTMHHDLHILNALPMIEDAFALGPWGNDFDDSDVEVW